MKLPFITTKRHKELLDEALHEQRSRIVVYVPAPYPLVNGEPTQIPSDDYCFHDPRIGWVRRVEFDTYDDYCDYIKLERKLGNIESKVPISERPEYAHLFKKKTAKKKESKDE